MDENERQELDEALKRHREELDKILTQPPEEWLAGLNQENDRHYHFMTRLLFRMRQRRKA